MIDQLAFAEGLARIGVACRQEPDAATLRVYFDALQDDTDADEWKRFTLSTVKGGRWTWFPKLSELLDALRDFRGLPTLDAEATTAYDRVLRSGIYSPESGTYWDHRTIRGRCGDAAAEAFLAAGGHSAFATTRGEEKRLERFVEAYKRSVKADPEAALLPAGAAAKQIEGGR